MDKTKLINPDRARGFLIAVMKEWDRQGLSIRSIRVNRNSQDVIQNVLLTYDERRETDNGKEEDDE